MKPATKLLHEALLRHLEGCLAAWKKWLAAQAAE